MFVASGRLFRLRYAVAADSMLRTRHALVTGHAGTQPVRADIRRGTGGQWTLGGREQPHLSGCIDVDLAFTPATNLLPLRLLGLRPGQAAPAPAAWLELDPPGLSVLAQCYRRISRCKYSYEAAAFGYRETLRVSRAGLVLHYPGLFEAIATSCP